MIGIFNRKQGRPSRRPFFIRPFSVPPLSVPSVRLAATVLAPLAVALLSVTPADAAMRGYIVTSFDTIRVEAPVRIVLTTGSGVSGTGEGEREALDRVTLSVSGGVLTVTMASPPESRFADGKPASVPTLYLATGQLRRAQVIGGAALAIRGLAGLEADLSMNGNGEILLDQADVERLSLYVSGGGRITVSGKARDVRASVNGPGALEAQALDARNATIANDGPGSIHMSVYGPATIVSTGSGDTVVGGKPVCSITRRGVGEVICGG